MHTRLNPITQEKGAVVLATMGILLSMVSLSMWVVSQRLNNELHMVKHGLAYNQAYDQLRAQHASLSRLLRTADINTLQSMGNEQLDITHQLFINSNNTHSVLFTVTLSSSSPSLQIKQGFLRFSSLFWLPQKAVTEGGTDIVQKLFNRNIEELSSSHFQHVLATSGLDDAETIGVKALAENAVIWVEGDWELLNDTDLGSIEAPVLVIVKNGNITLGERSSFYGLLVHLDTASSRHKVSLEDGTKLYGALVSNRHLTLNSDGIIKYEKDVLSTLQQRAELQNIYSTPHSWSDFD